jgi:two-component system response regulator YesN
LSTLPHFLWVNLTSQEHTALKEAVVGAFDVYLIKSPIPIHAAIKAHAPQFLCFEFDDPSPSYLNALADTRREYPGLPVLLITGCSSQSLAIWALRIRVWDILVKPILLDELIQRITVLINLTCQRPSSSVRKIWFPQQSIKTPLFLKGIGTPKRTYPAIELVETSFQQKIFLDHVATLCRLSPSHFCHVFKQEQGMSFGQYLLRYRLQQACVRLIDPSALTKEVAYAVGFNDLSYFTWAFKRQIGVCPTQYHKQQCDSPDV